VGCNQYFSSCTCVATEIFHLHTSCYLYFYIYTWVATKIFIFVYRLKLGFQLHMGCN
jgi:hypothetical protein